MNHKIDWTWKRWEDLSRDELYEIIGLRERVFVVEQNAVYLDVDGRDRRSSHLMGWMPATPVTGGPFLAAYLRVVQPGVTYAELSIGRVVTAPEARRTGAGRAIMLEGIRRIENEHGPSPIRISAQAYLERFYAGLGFEKVHGPYMEDGIPHLEMLRPAGQ
ncbi:MAG: GNAT family N-acetyltransferase [Bdellovibrionales bacterium]|nr:GNAT family N-acetyltransferase [Bdellovibrionales bacterium]